MQSPTTTQIRTAIEVLEKLGERLNERAAHSVIQLPDTQLREHDAGRIEVKTIEQITQIQTVAAQLEQWRDEFLQQRR